MNNDQFVRYKTLDRCFRNNSGSYTIDHLIAECTRAVCLFHGDLDRKVARRTVEKDIEDLRLRYSIKLIDKLYLGHKKLYRYEDTSFSLMNKLLADGELEQMMLTNVLDTLRLYDDMPQYKWLYVFMQQRMNGMKAENAQAIEFQNNPDLLGMDNFGVLLDAILNKTPLCITYQAYNKPPQDYHISPYLLKQFNDRWFLIANTDGYDNLSNFAIDRIHEVVPINITYRPVGLDLAEYFEDIIGVTRSDHKPVEEVLIRISKKRYSFVETKPLHASQRPIHEMWTDTHRVIKLRVQINNELEAAILALGNDAEVLAPLHFREQIFAKIRDLFDVYSNSAD